MPHLRRHAWVLVAVTSLARTLPAQQIVAASANRGQQSVEGVQRVTLDLRSVTYADALKEITRQTGIVFGYPVGLLPDRPLVTLKASGLTVEQAATRVLAGTVVTLGPRTATKIALVPRMRTNVRTQGTVTGRVLDASTKRPISGATVQVDGTNLTAQTADDGTFRISNVSPGTHTMVVRYIGYSRVSRPVTVGEELTASIEVLLEVSVKALDQIVVTGTIVQTELKAVPSAITVVTAKQIEERGITKIDQLFRGDIPGLFALNAGSSSSVMLDEVTMFSRGATALSPTSVPGSLTSNSNPFKTYIDGVEVADPKYLSQIDPKSIERIEILTGPQASTIYGSNAINGVMQVFTKRGSASHPQLSVSLLSGWVENNFTSARTPQHDYSAQLNDVEGRLSYNAGGSWNYMGPWTPAKQSARTGGFGGARLDLSTAVGRMTADMTLRRSLTQSLQRGQEQQTITGYREDGWYLATNLNGGIATPTTRTLVGQTVGLTLTYIPAAWGSHEFGLGQDVSDAEIRLTARGNRVPSDTVLKLVQSHVDRRSIRYATTARVPITSTAQATVTAGADAWQSLASSWQVEPQTLTGSLAGTTTISRQPSHNTGGFLQAQVGLEDRLFLTYGLRAEWNPNFGAEAQPNYAPRYGMAYTQGFNALTAKMRVSYGRSTRPPAPGQKIGQTYTNAFGQFASANTLQYYGDFYYQIANPDLTPEYQQGGEGGLELYFGTRGSLIVTRYNQIVDKLIASVKIDSARSNAICVSPACSGASIDPDGYGYQYQYQQLNLGSIRNQGWELQGSVNIGPITTRGTYSWTKSRVIGIAPEYRWYFANSSQYQRGATFTYLPEHTWATGMTYARSVTTVGLNLTGKGRLRNIRDDFFVRTMDDAIRLPQNRWNTRGIFATKYINFAPGETLVDMTASHRFASTVEGLVQIQNLTDRYQSDYDGTFAVMGRQAKAGFRIRMQ